MFSTIDHANSALVIHGPVRPTRITTAPDGVSVDGFKCQTAIDFMESLIDSLGISQVLKEKEIRKEIKNDRERFRLGAEMTLEDVILFLKKHPGYDLDQLQGEMMERIRRDAEGPEGTVNG